MKIIEWNVKNMNQTKCLSCLADEINGSGRKPDIVVLTEYNIDANKGGNFEKEMQKNGYILKSRGKSSGNGNADILIAVKESDDISIVGDVCFGYKYNYLILKTKIRSEEVYIVGLRVRVHSGKYDKKEQEYRLKQLKNILGLPELNKAKRVIMVGDFNNYKSYGDENEIENYAEYYKGKNQKKYNIQAIKKLYDEKGYDYKNSAPENENEYSYKLKTQYRYDHIFTKGFSVDKTTYDWKWKDSVKDKKKRNKEKGYIPDHAILSADISLK